MCWRPVVACAVTYGAVRGFLASFGPLPEFMQLLGAMLAACTLGVILYLGPFLRYGCWPDGLKVRNLR